MALTREQAVKVKQKDYLGNAVTILHYEAPDGRRVREWPDGSMLIELRPGRFRNFPADHWMCALAKGETLRDSPIARAIFQLQDHSRRHAAGTHEPFTYYRDRDGKVGVPPEPGLEPPDNVTVHTANTLHEADRLCREMQEQMYDDFQDDGVATAAFDQMTGVGDGRPYSRDDLVHAMSHGRGRKERDVARLMLEDLDKEERDRQRVTTSAHFHWREYDR